MAPKTSIAKKRLAVQAQANKDKRRNQPTDNPKNHKLLVEGTLELLQPNSKGIFTCYHCKASFQARQPHEKPENLCQGQRSLKSHFTTYHKVVFSKSTTPSNMRLYPSSIGLEGDDIALFGQMWSDSKKSSRYKRAVAKALEDDELRQAAYEAWKRFYKLKSLDDYQYNRNFFLREFDEYDYERGPFMALALWRTALMMDLEKRPSAEGEIDEETSAVQGALSASTEMLRLCAWELKEFMQKHKKRVGYVNSGQYSELCIKKGTYSKVSSLIGGCKFNPKTLFLRPYISQLQSMVETISVSCPTGQQAFNDDDEWFLNLCARDIEQFSKVKQFILPNPPFEGDPDKVFEQAEMEAKLQFVSYFKDLKKNNELGKFQKRKDKKSEGAKKTRRKERASRRAQHEVVDSGSEEDDRPENSLPSSPPADAIPPTLEGSSSPLTTIRSSPNPSISPPPLDDQEPSDSERGISMEQDEREEEDTMLHEGEMRLEAEGTSAVGVISGGGGGLLVEDEGFRGLRRSARMAARR
ncbi:hypothetical protein B9479_007480 [Cryptococcus floricola]|uniref:Uncharacterized protein n=1 Tax=Cryptococcus floricola TaxID=2591691 RepID=A0A5D3ANJ8_9TREE|nr:hypothetical protein B9479_007480 [Cryptococcus floricola]